MTSRQENVKKPTCKVGPWGTLNQKRSQKPQPQPEGLKATSEIQSTEQDFRFAFPEHANPTPARDGRSKELTACGQINAPRL
jgi:hypothetical protein